MTIEKAKWVHGCCADKSCSSDTCMALPEGKTCGDCAHCKRCCSIFGASPENTSCEWFPRRFKAVEVLP